MFNKHPMYLYLVKTTCCNDPLIKIGITWNLKIRFRTLKRGLNRQLTILGYKIFTSEYEARGVEKTFHRLASRGEYRGEWHNWDPEIVQTFLMQDGVTIGSK